LLLAATNLL